ncbi:Crp/Fnr family transcriptional regulator [Poritiphilus flavus]|uniref:Cyclic nucleotide-binding domain-containing protein n=1 Tax=Poritiphilus flavus TaxID=2697053 RepID=A0A6L9EHC9_9FLAO|nr:Crp/Fnr family transcriptional regulator [Poritiphilus flavus]NAS14052.1 cyclic nucleotide-binding domain-containing protein [Poritiphilus flavus]
MNTLTKYWFLEGFDLFRKLSMPTMMRICKLLEMENKDKGEVISLGDRDRKNIFFLKKGTVKIIDTSTDTIKYIVKKGNLFGELALYDEETASKEQAITLEDSIICYIEADMMEDLMSRYRSLKNGVLKIYGLRIKRLERRLQDLLYKDSATRIREFVFAYIQEFGQPLDGRLVAKNLLSHQDIAHLTNTSRQTVSNTLSILRKDKQLDYDARMLSIPMPGSLANNN